MSAVATSDPIERMKRNQQIIDDLQLQLAKKESQVRRAAEEQQLRGELHAIDKLTLRKLESDEGVRKNRMLISEESLAHVLELEDALKLESKKTSDLTVEATSAERSLVDVDRAIAAVQEKTATVLDRVGMPQLLNEEAALKKALEELVQQQAVLKHKTAQMTRSIEELTRELESRKNVEQDLEDAERMLAEKHREHESLQDKVKSLHRISQKKEKLYKTMAAVDDSKSLRQLEAEKRVLHTDIGRHSDLVRINEKSIAANKQRIAQLNARLQLVAQQLSEFFTDAADRKEHWPEGSAEDSTTVPASAFEALHEQVVEQRALLVARDQQLEEADAIVESFEKKVDIVSTAQKSRTQIAQQEANAIERERAELQTHVNGIERDFEMERQRLLLQRERLLASKTALAAGAH